MYQKIYEKMCHKFDPDKRVSLARSSTDPELDRYFRAMNAYGSTHMEEDGAIYVKIHDQGGASRATWLEEYAHALQFLRDGHVELSVDDSERRERELEVARCLLADKRERKLSVADKQHYQQVIEIYGKDDD
jgi:hypothetical protein